MYSDISRRGDQQAAKLILLAGSPMARFEWLQANIEKLPEASTVAILASGEILAGHGQSVTEHVLAFDAQLRVAGYNVTRMAVGCVCCSSKLLLNTHLGRLMRLLQPSTMVLELDTSSHQANIRTMLCSGQWSGWFSPIEVVNLTDKE